MVAVTCLTGLAVALPHSAQAVVCPSIYSVVGPIPVTATSHPFDPAAGTNYQALGYLQQEYFISGCTNEYKLTNPSDTHSFAVSVNTPDLPFTTRILMRYPANPARFSGNVIVEFLNPSGGYDIATAWLAYWNQIIANGDIWVGVTCKKSIVLTTCLGFPEGLYAFDPWRYAGGGGYPTLFFSRDRAQAWDIFTQLGILLKSNVPSNPLVHDGFSVSNVKLIGHGYSQTGGYMITYINFFAKPANLAYGKPVYDGFLANSAGGPIWLNDDGQDPCLPSMAFGPYPATDPRRIIQPCGVPVIHTLTETEIWMPDPSLSALITRRPDSDTSTDLFRRYEIPGACHMNAQAFAWGPTNADIYKVLHYVCPFCCKGTMSDFPAQYIHDAILANMEKWIRNGTPPPKANRIQTTGSGSIVRDAYGNAKGGLRSPWVDVPIKTYSPYSVACPSCPPATLCLSCSFWCSIFGNIAPLDTVTLKQLYWYHDNYVAKFTDASNQMFKGRWVTKADLALMIKEAKNSKVLVW